MIPQPQQNKIISLLDQERQHTLHIKQLQDSKALGNYYQKDLYLSKNTTAAQFQQREKDKEISKHNERIMKNIFEISNRGNTRIRSQSTSKLQTTTSVQVNMKRDNQRVSEENLQLMKRLANIKPTYSVKEQLNSRFQNEKLINQISTFQFKDYKPTKFNYHEQYMGYYQTIYKDPFEKNLEDIQKPQTTQITQRKNLPQTVFDKNRKVQKYLYNFCIKIEPEFIKFFVQNLEIKEKSYQLEFSIKEGVRILIEECDYDFNRMVERIKIDPDLQEVYFKKHHNNLLNNVPDTRPIKKEIFATKKTFIVRYILQDPGDEFTPIEIKESQRQDLWAMIEKTQDKYKKRSLTSVKLKPIESNDQQAQQAIDNIEQIQDQMAKTQNTKLERQRSELKFKKLDSDNNNHNNNDDSIQDGGNEIYYQQNHDIKKQDNSYQDENQNNYSQADQSQIQQSDEQEKQEIMSKTQSGQNSNYQKSNSQNSEQKDVILKISSDKPKILIDNTVHQNDIKENEIQNESRVQKNEDNENQLQSEKQIDQNLENVKQDMINESQYEQDQFEVSQTNYPVENNKKQDQNYSQQVNQDDNQTDLQNIDNSNEFQANLQNKEYQNIPQVNLENDTIIPNSDKYQNQITENQNQDVNGQQNSPKLVDNKNLSKIEEIQQSELQQSQNGYVQKINESTIQINESLVQDQNNEHLVQSIIKPNIEIQDQQEQIMQNSQQSQNKNTEANQNLDNEQIQQQSFSRRPSQKSQKQVATQDKESENNSLIQNKTDIQPNGSQNQLREIEKQDTSIANENEYPFKQVTNKNKHPEQNQSKLEIEGLNTNEQNVEEGLVQGRLLTQNYDKEKQ